MEKTSSATAVPAKRQYTVKYFVNGKAEKKVCFDRDEAFGFQSGLLVERRRTPEGAWDIELDGVYAEG